MSPTEWFLAGHTIGMITWGTIAICILLDEDKMKKTMKRKVASRPHQWGGGGYICYECGAIKDTSLETKTCPGKGKSGFDVWLYYAGAGWWRAESEIDTHKKASAILSEKIGIGNVVAGAILPAGNPLGLFTKQMVI